MRNRLRRRLRRAVLVGLFTILALTAIELRLRDARPRFAAWLRHRPLAVADSPYWNDAFLHEREGFQFDFDPDGAFRAMSFAGQYFAYHDGVKGVGDYTPAHPHHTLYIFGDSTAADWLAPDSLSITGLLQRKLGDDWRVETRAGGDLFSDWELKALKRVPLRAGDVVMFYDGAEASLPFWTARDKQLRVPKLCPANSVLYELELFWLACGWVWTTPDPVFDNPTWLADQAQQVARHHQDNIAAATAYTTAHGARFVNVLHPYIWTAPLTDYDRQAVDTIRHSDRIGESYNAVYPLMSGPYTVDLSHALDDARSRGLALYVDAYHVADRGDQIMAEAIWRVLLLEK